MKETQRETPKTKKELRGEIPKTRDETPKRRKELRGETPKRKEAARGGTSKVEARGKALKENKEDRGRIKIRGETWNSVGKLNVFHVESDFPDLEGTPSSLPFPSIPLFLSLSPSFPLCSLLSLPLLSLSPLLVIFQGSSISFEGYITKISKNLHKVEFFPTRAGNFSVKFSSRQKLVGELEIEFKKEEEGKVVEDEEEAEEDAEEMTEGEGEEEEEEKEVEEEEEEEEEEGDTCTSDYEVPGMLTIAKILGNILKKIQEMTKAHKAPTAR
jgi:hypothetical protein